MTDLKKTISPSSCTLRVFDPPTAQGHSHLKILLLKLDHIGDFVVAIEGFRLMRRAFSGAEITLICLPGLVEFAESTGLFDKVKGFAAVPESPALAGGAVVLSPASAAVFKALLDEPYFLAADFKHDPFERFGLDHVEARYRAAFTAPTEKGLDIVIPVMEWAVPATQVAGKGNLPPHAEVRMTLLATAIIETLLEKPMDADLFGAREDMAGIPSYRALEAIKAQKIGISIGAGAVLRQWKVEHWMALIGLLRQTDQAQPPHFVFFGSEADQVQTRMLTSLLPPERVTDLTGALPLSHSAAYMDLLDAYIGCDTGLTHLAAHLDIPTVNIFAGISNVSVWRARGPRVKTIYAEISCAPCHKRLKPDCPYDNLCMTAITPEAVHTCFEQLRAF